MPSSSLRNSAISQGRRRRLGCSRVLIGELLGMGRKPTHPAEPKVRGRSDMAKGKQGRGRGRRLK